METCTREGSHEGGKIATDQETPSHGALGDLPEPQRECSETGALKAKWKNSPQRSC